MMLQSKYPSIQQGVKDVSEILRPMEEQFIEQVGHDV